MNYSSQIKTILDLFPKIFSRLYSVAALLLFLFSFSIVYAAPVSAETCGDTGQGTCRDACAYNETAPTLNGLPPNNCSIPSQLCCLARPAIASCTEVCLYISGCVCPSNCIHSTAPSNSTCGGVEVAPNVGESSTVFGTIRQPVGTERFGGAGQIGILAFVSVLIRIATIVAGLIVLFNFIISGYTYLTSEGNPKAHEEVRNRITYSVIGIVLIVSAYTITALLSLIFFGSATFILNPTIAPPTP